MDFEVVKPQADLHVPIEDVSENHWHLMVLHIDDKIFQLDSFLVPEKIDGRHAVIRKIVSANQCNTKIFAHVKHIHKYEMDFKQEDWRGLAIELNIKLPL